MKEVSFDKKYFIETYGCQMNESDTERISGQLEELGYVPADILDDARSEERRVGKECRSRWSPYH